MLAQDVEMPGDSASIAKVPYTLATDSVPRRKNALDAPVEYQATDSIVMTSGNWAYLFGDGDVIRSSKMAGRNTNPKPCAITSRQRKDTSPT